MFNGGFSQALLPCAVLVALGACSKSEPTDPGPPADQIEFSAAQLGALDSIGRAMEHNNSADGDIRSLVDSTLFVLTSGTVAKRLDVTTNLTSLPLYFVGVHRVYTGAASFSTWTVIGMDDPVHLTSIVEVGGYTPTNADALSGPLSDVLNGRLVSVGPGVAVTKWFAASGSASLASSAAGTPCPNFPPTPNIACTMETIHVSFSVSGSSDATGAGSRQASVAGADVPAMRLTYTVH
jgi:hypothetical protein